MSYNMEKNPGENIPVIFLLPMLEILEQWLKYTTWNYLNLLLTIAQDFIFDHRANMIAP